jgi:hypothetical protein
MRRRCLAARTWAASSATLRRCLPRLPLSCRQRPCTTAVKVAVAPDCALPAISRVPTTWEACKRRRITGHRRRRIVPVPVAIGRWGARDPRIRSGTDDYSSCNDCRMVIAAAPAVFDKQVNGYLEQQSPAVRSSTRFGTIAPLFSARNNCEVAGILPGITFQHTGQWTR